MGEASFLAYFTEILAPFSNSIALEENCRHFFFATGRARIFGFPAYSTVWFKGRRLWASWTVRYTGDRLWKWESVNSYYLVITHFTLREPRAYSLRCVKCFSQANSTKLFSPGAPHKIALERWLRIPSIPRAVRGNRSRVSIVWGSYIRPLPYHDRSSSLFGFTNTPFRVPPTSPQRWTSTLLSLLYPI